MGWQAWMWRERGKGGGGVRRSVSGREKSVTMKTRRREKVEGVVWLRAEVVCHDMKNKSTIYSNQNLGLKLN